MTARALPVLIDLVRHHAAENFLIVSHKATIRLLLSSLLGFDPTRIASVAPKDEARPSVVVSMGGSDPLNLTRLAACAPLILAAGFLSQWMGTIATER